MSSVQLPVHMGCRPATWRGVMQGEKAARCIQAHYCMAWPQQNEMLRAMRRLPGCSTGADPAQQLWSAHLSRPSSTSRPHTLTSSPGQLLLLAEARCRSSGWDHTQ